MSSLGDAVGALLGRLIHLEGPMVELLARLLVIKGIPFPQRVVYLQTKTP